MTSICTVNSACSKSRDQLIIKCRRAKATLNPALFLGLSDSLGTIEAEKTANLLLLEANPLQEIHNTKRIAAVIPEGRYLDRLALDRMLRESCRNCSGNPAH
jgi:Amidohydrolase family